MWVLTEEKGKRVENLGFFSPLIPETVSSERAVTLKRQIYVKCTQQANIIYIILLCPSPFCKSLSSNHDFQLCLLN